MANAGILYETMQSKPDVPADAFNDWYNNEYGPLRLKLPFFTSGLRYRATDDLKPEWMVINDVTDMETLKTLTSLSLRANRSQREAGVVKDTEIARFFYDLTYSTGDSTTQETPPVVVAVRRTLKSSEAENDFDKWCKEEHIPLLARIPGWLRSRQFKTSSSLSDPGTPCYYLALHDYKSENGLGGPEHKYSMSTPWRAKVQETINEQARRTYGLYYEFGPSPRDLASLPASEKFIESTFSMSDGQTGKYRLQGNTNPEAPVIVFSNSLLTTWDIWDQFIESFAQQHPEFRILRYNTRGRDALNSSSTKPITLELLAKDIAALLDGLCIPKVHAVMGVSLGGATVLRFALEFPHRLNRFVACDFNIASSPKNFEAWEARIKVGRDSMAKLAEQTVSRWFLPENLHSRGAKATLKMVESNDVEGFVNSVKALYMYDMTGELERCQVPGLFVVGEGDGALPDAMRDFSMKAGKGKFKVVEKAGHLPMVENVQGFAAAVAGFL
ncbi:hypothetical protein MMC08_002847 [Hypocenomyce scalaris]|nr:hypothetical protein [Hypocenomyce scalaris]